MSVIQIKNVILRTFKHSLLSFQYLVCNEKTSLAINADQSQDGNKLINSLQAGKGILYILKYKEQ